MNEKMTFNGDSDWDFLKELTEDEKIQLITRLISRFNLTVSEVELIVDYTKTKQLSENGRWYSIVVCVSKNAMDMHGGILGEIKIGS